MKTTAERVEAMRKRDAEAGLVRVEVKVPVSGIEAIRELAAKLREKMK